MVGIKRLVLCALFIAGSSAFAELCITQQQAQEAATELYKKGANMYDTLSNSESNFSKWESGQLEELGKSVKFGQWYISQSLGGNASLTSSNPDAAIAALDPVNMPFNPDEIYDGQKIWMKINPVFGAINFYDDANPRRLGGGVNFIYCKLNADKDMAMAFSICVSGSFTATLNGDYLVNANGGWSSCAPTIVKLNLKKGENVFVIRIRPVRNVQTPVIYIAPYASPAIDMAKLFAKDYPFEFAAASANGSSVKNDIRFISLFAGRNYKGSFKYLWEYMLDKVSFSGVKMDKEYKELVDKNIPSDSKKWLKLACDILGAIKADEALGYDPKSVVASLEKTAHDYPEFDKNLIEEAKKWEPKVEKLISAYASGDESAKEGLDEWKKFARSALLKNPLLQKTNKWVFVSRDRRSPMHGLPQNWQGNHVLKKAKAPYEKLVWNDELRIMEISGDAVTQKTLFKPDTDSSKGVLDLDVDWDAKKILFTSYTPYENFQIFEVDSDGKNLRQITPDLQKSKVKEENVDNYDGVYLPDGKIIYVSTVPYVGVPCVSGTDYVGNLFSLNPDAGSPEEVDKTIKQLTFEQDADWMPTVMHNGRIMYTRWEYTDNSHYFARILMHMNPDGTAQSSYYGSTSYWPNSLFYARQVPGEPSKFVGIVSGHHGIRRWGELHLFDVSKGTVEGEGQVHKFLSRGREFKPIIKDQLVDGKSPLFLHPYPLSADFVVATMERLDGSTGIYLVDTFGNATEILASDKGHIAMEAMPLLPHEKPQQIADRTNPDSQTGYVFLTDVYQGNGLKDVPRGTVKALRVFEYYYAYREMGSHDAISQEGSWDVKRILGTVPVYEDGSAMFEVPANRPIAVQPLDAEGKALALMRSWFVVMPGEVQSCVGCHEGQGMTPTTTPALASRKAPSKLKPFRGPVRGYSFIRDVQPVLDKYCVGCHNGQAGRPDFTRGKIGFRNFEEAYLNLHPYVRRTGPESNQNMLMPLEFHCDTSELIQLLKKGHKGVKLSDEDMASIITWIDLNVPSRGTWGEVKPIPFNGHKLRMESLAKYANRHDDPEKIEYDPGKQEFMKPGEELKHKGEAPKVEGWPFDRAKADELVDKVGLPKELEIDLGKGQKLRLRLIPAGSYVMGSNKGFYDEGPARAVKIEKPFYMGQYEISNAQYNVFDEKHDSGHLDRQWKDHVNKGYPANEPEQSVMRVSYNRAEEFCKWLSEKTGLKVSLPTEEQWEWAARGGTEGDFYYGDMDSDFSIYENLSDIQTKKFAVLGIDPQPVPNPIPFNAFTPADYRFDDGALVHIKSGNYLPNPFGLYDMLGNVCEWTRGGYTETLGGKPVEDKVVARGGSWRDRPKWARVSIRKDYRPWQGVYNVGFRIVVEDAEAAAKILKQAAPLPPKKANKIEILQDTLDTSQNRIKLVKPKSATGNLVRNGDFSEPSPKGGVFPSDKVPWWQSTIESIEIWGEGVMNSPAKNSAGKNTGAHLEIASSGYPPFKVFQDIIIPAGIDGKEATFSFDAWARAMTKSSVQVSVNDKVVLDEPLKGDTKSWTKNTYKIPSLKSGDKVRITFTEMGNGVSWHVDDVVLTFDNK